jgi:hypothetical protein
VIARFTPHSRLAAGFCRARAVSYDLFIAAVNANEVLWLAIGNNFVFYLLRFLCLLDDELALKLLPKTDGVNVFVLNFSVQVVGAIAIPCVILVEDSVLLVA